MRSTMVQSATGYQRLDKGLTIKAQVLRAVADSIAVVEGGWAEEALLA